MEDKFENDLKLEELRAIKKILLENQAIMKNILKVVSSDKNRQSIGELSENALAEEAEENIDPLFSDAVELTIELGKISASLLQRKFKLGYARASRLIDKMEDYKIISEYKATRSREVLISKREWEKIKEEKLKI